MSRYKTIVTELKDRNALLAAIAACGLLCEVAAPGERLPLYGYEGRQRPETADVVIRRRHIGGAANDLGFVEQSGRFEVVISEYDEGGFEGTGLYVLNRVRQQYAYQQVVALAQQQGYVVQPVEAEGGVIRLQLVRY